MDRFRSNKNAKQTYYEIFSSCRLCGAGGGYKMPVLQNVASSGVVDIGVELHVKIRECVSIEVKENDKMPPLVCELCVDKIDDFFEFREMCRTTDSSIRSVLGLPPQTQEEDCILGISGPVFSKASKEVDSPSRVKGKGKADLSKVKPDLSKLKKEIKKEKSPVVDLSKRTRGKADERKGKEKDVKRESSPIGSRTTRNTKASPQPSLLQMRNSLKREREKEKEAEKEKSAKNAKKPKLPPPPPPKLPEKRRSSIAPASSPVAKRSAPSSSPIPPEKRSSKEPIKVTRQSPVAAKLAAKVQTTKASPKTLPTKLSSKPPLKPSPAKAQPKPPPPKKKEEEPKMKCEVCQTKFFLNLKALASHMKSSHAVTFTSEKVCCNACREWYLSAEELTAHHKWHRSSDTYYHCHKCVADFKFLTGYLKHFDAKQCVPDSEVPDLECPECLGKFPTKNWIDRHKCPGVDGRPGGKCDNCNRKYARYKMLMKHREACLPKDKTKGANVSPVLLKKLLPMQVRMQKCDQLLEKIKMEPTETVDLTDTENALCHYDVSHVKTEYGLDSSAVYPYISAVRSMKEDNEYYSYESDLSDVENQGVKNPFTRSALELESLSRICLRSIFNARFFRSRRRRPKKKIGPRTRKVVFADEMVTTVDSPMVSEPDDEMVELNKDDDVENLDATAEDKGNDEVTEKDNDETTADDAVPSEDTPAAVPETEREAEGELEAEAVTEEETEKRAEIEAEAETETDVVKETTEDKSDVGEPIADEAMAAEADESVKEPAEVDESAVEESLAENELEAQDANDDSLAEKEEEKVQDSTVETQDEEEVDEPQDDKDESVEMKGPESTIDATQEEDATHDETTDKKTAEESVIEENTDEVRDAENTNDAQDSNAEQTHEDSTIEEEKAPEAEASEKMDEAPNGDGRTEAVTDEALRNGDDNIATDGVAVDVPPVKTVKDTCDDLDNVSDGEMFD